MSTRTAGRITHRIRERLRQRSVVKALDKVYKLVPGYEPNATKGIKVIMVLKYVKYLTEVIDFMATNELMHSTSAEGTESVLRDRETTSSGLIFNHQHRHFVKKLPDPGDLDIRCIQLFEDEPGDVETTEVPSTYPGDMDDDCDFVGEILLGKIRNCFAEANSKVKSFKKRMFSNSADNQVPIEMLPDSDVVDVENVEPNI